jgi:hypothetical protein
VLLVLLLPPLLLPLSGLAVRGWLLLLLPSGLNHVLLLLSLPLFLLLLLLLPPLPACLLLFLLLLLLPEGAAGSSPHPLSSITPALLPPAAVGVLVSLILLLLLLLLRGLCKLACRFAGRLLSVRKALAGCAQCCVDASCWQPAALQKHTYA